MKRLFFQSMLIGLFLTSCKNKDPQKIERKITLEFDSIFAQEQKFNFNPSKFWGFFLRDTSYHKSIDACIGTNHIDNLYIISNETLPNSLDYWNIEHKITVIDTNNKVKYKKTFFPPFAPTDIVGNVNNEFAISEASETPDIYILSDLKEYKIGSGLIEKNQNKFNSFVNKLSNNPNFDLVFQYDTWDYRNGIYKQVGTNIGTLKNNLFSKIDFPIEEKISAITFDSKNNIWALNYSSSLITVFNPNGKEIMRISNKYGLREPFALCSNFEGLIFIGDTGNNRIVVLNEEGDLVTTFGTFGQGNGQFNVPTDLCFLKNKLYVVDKKNNRVQVLKLIE